MLVAADDEAFAALVAGHSVGRLAVAPELETIETLTMLADLARMIRADFDPAAWLIVEHGTVVGLISLVAPPAAGAIAIGYGVAPSCRREGLARGAVAELLATLAADRRVAAVTAETSMDNPASQRVLEANGFHRTGERNDAVDGPLFGWQFDLPHGAIRLIDTVPLAAARDPA